MKKKINLLFALIFLMAIMPFVNATEQKISYLYIPNETLQRGCYLYLCTATSEVGCTIPTNKTTDFPENNPLLTYNVTQITFRAFRRGNPGTLNITLVNSSGTIFAYNNTFNANNITDNCYFYLDCIAERLNISMTPVLPIKANETYSVVIYGQGGVGNELEVPRDWYYTVPNPNDCNTGSGSLKLMYELYGEPIAPIDPPNVQISFPIEGFSFTNASEVTLSYFANSTDLQACWFTLDFGAINTTINECSNTTFNAYSEIYIDYTLRVYANDSFGQIGYADVHFNTGTTQLCLDNKGIIDLILPFVPLIILLGLAIMIMGLWSGKMSEHGAVEIVVVVVGFVIMVGVAMMVLMSGGQC